MRGSATRTWEEVEAERAEEAAKVASVVFVYCRSSFVDKKKVDRQDRQGVEWAKGRWPEAEVVVFKDDGHSGGSDDRPRWNEMKIRLAAGEADAVVTYTVSRITRDVTIGEQFAKLCRSAGIKDIWMAGADKPVSVREADMGEWRQHIVMATQQREDAKVSSANALERNAIDGVPNGKAPFGYINARHPDDERAVWLIDTKAAAVVRKIFDWADAGLSSKKITQRLNEQGVPTATGSGAWWSGFIRNGILSNTCYIGRQTFGGVLYPVSDRWEPIIDQGQFERVQRYLERTSRNTSGNSHKYWAGAILRCGTCGSTMNGGSIARNTGGRTPAFMCSVRNGLGKTACAKPMSWSPAPTIEHFFATILVERVNSPEFAEMVGEAGVGIDQRGAMLDRIDEIDSKRAKLAKSFTADLITEDMMTEALSELMAERSACVAVLDSMQAADDGPTPSDLVGITLDEFNDLSLKAKRAAAQIVFDKVVVSSGTRKGFNPRSGELNESRFEISYREDL